MDREHYRVGWNDTEYGLNHWTGSDLWENPVQWAVHMKMLAEECQVNGNNSAYCQGVIDCCNQYQETGKVARK